ncbi:MAG: JDVT-CTERM domain-containing protein [Hydrogenophaga sp.]|uniref:Agd3-related carbohydrate deacetylase n=1 Tax=Hydrogenophaga sp. TaxID=1904254 RepID=UPI0027322502|nr:CARDB domain-containing protein [Hydrogenophaga sp.]MDP2163821.1 JDVT-CTERM domain-containing protein [Hydrogenophaga sp.]
MSALNSFTQLRRGGSVRWASLRATGAWLLMAFGLSMLLAACGGGDGATPAGGSEARLSKAAITETRQSVDMRILLLSAQGNPDLIDAPKALLEKLGVPFDVLITSTNPTATAAALNALSDGNGNGKYQGFLLETDTLDIGGVSTLAAGQWAQLAQYQINFGVRQVVMYQNPYDPFSFGQTPVGGVSIAETPMKATLTDAGKQVFDYLNLTRPVDFIRTYWLQSTPATLNAGEKLDVLLENSGFIVASVFTEADGRQTLGLNLASNPNLNHVWLLGPGMVNWLTKGVYMGERSSYLLAQPDDVLSGSDIWNPDTNANGGTYRTSADDWNRLVAWQNGLRSNPNQAAIRLEMPFNGAGLGGETRPESYLYPANDPLTAAVKQSIVRKDFRWINHAYAHANMDSPTTAATILSELNENHRVAGLLGLTEGVDYFRDSFINPEISGLENAAFYSAANTYGLRHIVMDTSKCYLTFRPTLSGSTRLPPCDPIPTFGGYVDSRSPQLFIMPRYPTNLFYNVSTPAEWVDEYNYFYGPGGTLPPEQRFPTDRTYEQILDFESNVWLSYLLRYDPYPLMFHQANLRAYQSGNTALPTVDRNRSLLSDLIDMTISKYNAHLNLPIKSPSLHELGLIIQQRLAYQTALSSGLKGRILFTGVPNVTLEFRNPTASAITVPLSGSLYNGTAYGNQLVASIVVAPGQTVTAPAPESWGAKLEADLAINQTASTSTPALGGTVSFTLTMSNAGPAPVTNASFANTLPAGLGTITQVVSAVSGGATTASFNIGNAAISGLVSLPVGAQAQVTFRAKVSSTAASTLTNQATLAAPSDRFDPNPANNTAARSLSVVVPDLTASLALPPSAVAGSTVSGTMTVNNIGAGIATGVKGTVTLPGGTTLSLDFGNLAATTGTAQRSFNVAVPTSGPSLTLAASASTTAVESNTTNNGATSNALTLQYADVTTQITLPTSAPASSVVRGTVVFTNSATGPSAAMATAVTGSVTFSNGAPAQTFNIGNLAPGASSPPQAITVTLPASGSLTATSKVATTAVESNTANNSASASMSVEAETVASSGGGGGCTTNPDAAFDPLLLLLLLGGGLASVRRQRQARH